MLSQVPRSQPLLSRVEMIRPSIIISAISVLTAGFSFLNQVLIASYFGTTAQFDGYLAATSIPLMATGLLCGGLNFALIPALSSGQSHGLPVRQVRRELLRATILLAIAVSIIGAVAGEVMLPMFLSGFPARIIDEGIWLHRVTWVTVVFAITNAYFIALHNANGRFFLGAFSTIIPYVGMVACIVLLGSAMGVRAIALGMLIGSVAAAFVLSLSALGEIDFRGSRKGSNTITRSFLRGLPMLIIAMLTFSAYTFVDAFWASRLSEGAVSYLGYAQRILIAIGGVIVAGPFALLANRFVENYKEGEGRLNATMLASLKWLVLILCPVAMILMVLGEPIVAILLQRGKFTEESTRYVGSVLALMMPGMVAMLCGTILFRGFYARNDCRGPALIGATWAIIYFALSGIFSNLIGVYGIAIAYSIGWLVTIFLGLRLFLGKDAKRISWRPGLIYAAKVGGSIAIALAITQQARELLVDPASSHSAVSLIVRVALVALIGIAVFGLLSYNILKIGKPQG